MSHDLLSCAALRAICKSRNEESWDGKKGMRGMVVGMLGIEVGMRGMGV